MIKLALISNNKSFQEFFRKKNIKIFNNYEELLNSSKEWDIVFFHNESKENEFLDVYYEISTNCNDIVFIVILNEIVKFDYIKKGFKEGIYDFFLYNEFLKNFDNILNKINEHINVIKSQQKIYKLTTYKISIKIPSDINLVNETVLQIINTAKVSGFIRNKKLENNVRLALIEGIANAIVHGNKSDKNKYVFINAEITYNMLKVAIQDMGKGFELKNDINPLDEENILKSNGRGIYLMKILMDELDYDSSKKELILIKYKDKEE